jgi:hypothetical protein
VRDGYAVIEGLGRGFGRGLLRGFGHTPRVLPECSGRNGGAPIFWRATRSQRPALC